VFLYSIVHLCYNKKVNDYALRVIFLYIIYPEHTLSLPSMASRHTVHPEHKKPTMMLAFIEVILFKTG